MNPAASTLLVAERELRETFRRRSFWIIASLLLLGATAAMVLPALLSDDSRPELEVIVVGGDPEMTRLVRSGAAEHDLDLTIRSIDDAEEARAAVRDERADVAIVAGDDSLIITRSDGDDPAVTAARQALATRSLLLSLSEAGLGARQIDEVVSLPAPTIEQVDEERAGRRAVALVLSFVMYLLLLSLMVQVANGVAIEKSNRISEVLLPIVRPGALLFGKVIGVGIAGLVLISAGAVPVATKFALGGDLPEGIGGALAGTALWFVLGLVLYLTLSGSLGALVERQEQAGAVTAPLTFVLIATFVAAQGSADSTLGIVLAYIPLTSPLMVPARIAIGVATPLELVTSLLLLLAGIAFAGRVGSTIYSRAIVRTGKRLTLRDVLASP